MKVTRDWMYNKFEEFNERLFSGRCPSCEMKINQSLKYWGTAACRWSTSLSRGLQAREFKIYMSNAWDSPEWVLENTLAHEMIHIMDYAYCPEHFLAQDYYGRWKHVKYDAHGPIYFMRWAKKLESYGFDIMRNASSEEKAVSTLSEKFANREFYIVAIYYTPERAAKENSDVFYLKCTNNVLHKTILPILFKNYGNEFMSDSGVGWNKGAAKVEIYKSKTLGLQTKSYSKAFRGFKVSMSRWNTVKEMVLSDGELVRTIEYSQPQQPIMNNVDDNNINNNVINDKDSEVVPLFVLRSLSGKTLEIKNKTRGEIKRVVTKHIPKLTPEKIDMMIDKQMPKAQQPVNENIENMDENPRTNDMWQGNQWNGCWRTLNDGSIEMIIA